MTPPPMGPSGSPCRGLPVILLLVEEASAWELGNIVIQDPPEDTPKMDHFRECREEHGAVAPTDTFSVDAALHKEESMKQAPQSNLGEEGIKSSKESDSSKSIQHHYSSRHRHPDSISWADEDQEEGEEQEETEREEQLTPPASPQGKPMEEPMEELPALEQESLGVVLTRGDMPGDMQGEEVVIHVAEEEIECLC